MGNKQEVKSNKSKPRFKAGQTVWVKIRMFGMTSYEQHEVASVSKGKVILEDLRKIPFDAITGEDVSDKTYATGSMKLLSEKPEDYKPDEE